MAVQITINQATRPPGVAGVAREDCVTGQVVTLTSSGGPFLAYQWRIVHKPIDIVGGVRATSLLATSTAASTTMTPIDVAGTYLVELVVNSGSGLGALAADIARITFYAGPTLSATPNAFPRRTIAFQETTEHNVPDAIEPAGNTEGWSREWYKWFAAIQTAFSTVPRWARISLPAGGPAFIVSQSQIASATRTAVGTVDILFTTPLSTINYAVVCSPRNTGGMCVVYGETGNGFTVERADPSGVLVDDDFSFIVEIEVGS
jgi:hypothetical protein